MSHFDISVVFFLELAVILTACRVAGRLVLPLGQPQVVGEMIAGVLLGPSLLGALFPGLSAQLFPEPALAVLYSVAHVGLALYMFLVGLEFDRELIQRRVRSAVAVSWAGIITPFLIGGLLAWSIHDDRTLFGAGVKSGEAMLFMGAAMSITAFPMLARIIYESGLSGTSLGTLALAAGSADDAAAWCVLAIVLASFSGQVSVAVLAIAGGALFALLMLVVLRPRLERLGRALLAAGAWDRWGLSGALVIVLLSAFYADTVGIHSVFGAFIAGVAMPRGECARRLEAQLAPMTTHLLLPLFFTCSGLNTRIGLVSTPALWGLALLVLLGASLGKGVACWAAARLAGEPPRDAIAIGALMNARGLMELIILNIGLERGLITPVLFSIMVFMAVVTTLAATPVFRRVYLRPRAGAPVAAAQGV